MPKNNVDVIDDKDPPNNILKNVTVSQLRYSATY
jgi:hypothetical protein